MTIDLSKAKELKRRADRGEKLTPEERNYLDRALEIVRSRRAGPQGGADAKAPPPGDRQPRPTFADVKYGPHERNTLDFWQAPSEQPTPVVVFIHGGGFVQGDKRMGGNPEYLRHGVSVASINYRFSTHAIFPAPFLDCARAIQFLRSKAGPWNIDPRRIASTGGSAGGGMSLWLAFRDDLAEPDSDDPVARQSTRLSCVAVRNAQCSYDPRFIKSIIPGSAYKIVNLVKLFGMRDADEIDSPPAEKVRLFEAASAIRFLTPDDPPVFLAYGGVAVDHLPPNLDAGAGIHHPMFGKVLKEKMDELGIECVFRATRQELSSSPTEQEFVLKHLGRAGESRPESKPAR